MAALMGGEVLALAKTAVIALVVGVLHSPVVNAEPSAEGGWLTPLRRQLVARASQEYGLQPAPVADARRLVVSVHGYNSNAESGARLLKRAERSGLACAHFAYPNDQPLAESAHLLAGELRRLQVQRPERKVSLVAHSMGGLVARAVVEDPRLCAGTVDQLIMVGPPTHGSELARVAVGTDLWEHWLDRSSGSPWRRTRDSITDGLGEAARDLTPGSKFLVELNKRPRNARVRYTLILGSKAAVTDQQMEWLRRRLCGALSSIGARDSAGRLDNCLRQFDEVVDGKGDGVVAIGRARLEGVDDVVTLPFGHLEIVEDDATGPALDAQNVIVERLKTSS
ncbi:MAG: hypothetical protein AAF589_00315 [Planctomycetota bacterium]